MPPGVLGHAQQPKVGRIRRRQVGLDDGTAALQRFRPPRRKAICVEQRQRDQPGNDGDAEQAAASSTPRWYLRSAARSQSSLASGEASWRRCAERKKRNIVAVDAPAKEHAGHPEEVRGAATLSAPGRQPHRTRLTFSRCGATRPHGWRGCVDVHSASDPWRNGRRPMATTRWLTIGVRPSLFPRHLHGRSFPTHPHLHRVRPLECHARPSAAWRPYLPRRGWPFWTTSAGCNGPKRCIHPRSRERIDECRANAAGECPGIRPPWLEPVAQPHACRRRPRCRHRQRE